MRPVVILVATIAVAAAAGTAVSLTQHPPAATRHGSPQHSASPTLSPNVPAVAFGFSVAADPTTSRVVLFGGVANDGTTWLWNGAAWARAHPAASPTGRYGASAAFDPQSNQVLLFGGVLHTGEVANDTWAWDGTTWQEVDAGGSGPTPGLGSNMAWDAGQHEMVLVTGTRQGTVGGGETWIWSGARWVRVVTGALGTDYSGVVIAFDPMSNALLAEGCCEKQPKDVLGAIPSTWRWNGSTWRPLATRISPVDGSSLAVDPALGRLVLCACNLQRGMGPAMWIWSGHDWDRGPYPQIPIAPQAEVVDPSDDQLLVLGPAISRVDALVQNVEVWTSRGSAWVQLGLGNGP